jgi:hypothetical protein
MKTTGIVWWMAFDKQRPEVVEYSNKQKFDSVEELIIERDRLSERGYRTKVWWEHSYKKEIPSESMPSQIAFAREPRNAEESPSAIIQILSFIGLGVALLLIIFLPFVLLPINH